MTTCLVQWSLKTDTSNENGVFQAMKFPLNPSLRLWSYTLWLSFPSVRDRSSSCLINGSSAAIFMGNVYSPNTGQKSIGSTRQWGDTRWKEQRILTPSNNTAANEQLFALHERHHDDRMQVETFTEHPEEITRHEVLSNNMQSLAPGLQIKMYYNKCWNVFNCAFESSLIWKKNIHCDEPHSQYHERSIALLFWNLSFISSLALMEY